MAQQRQMCQECHQPQSLSSAPQLYVTGWQTAHKALIKKLIIKIASEPPCSLYLSRFKIYFKSLPSATPYICITKAAEKNTLPFFSSDMRFIHFCGISQIQKSRKDYSCPEPCSPYQC